MCSFTYKINIERILIVITQFLFQRINKLRNLSITLQRFRQAAVTLLPRRRRRSSMHPPQSIALLLRCGSGSRIVGGPLALRHGNHSCGRDRCPGLCCERKEQG